jgi:hypothetical protein
MSDEPQPRVLDAADARLHEEWFRNYIETLSPEEREAEIASRGYLWRYLEPRLIEAIRRNDETLGLGNE